MPLYPEGSMYPGLRVNCIIEFMYDRKDLIMEKTHVCLIGAGKHAAANIIPSIRAIPEITVDAVCTLHLENARNAISTLNPAGKAYDSIDAMLSAENSRNIIIVMQAADAFEAAKKCIRAGRAVFCEKPLGMDAVQALEIRGLAEKHQVPVMVGFMKKYAPAYQMIRKAIREQTYGQVCSYCGTMNVDASAFCSTDREFMYYVGIHFIALTRSLFGVPAEISCFSSSVPGGNSYHILFRHEEGIAGSIRFENRTAWSRESEDLTVTFENGYASASDLRTVRFHQSAERGDTVLSEKETVYFPSETPSSGSERDLLLRGFIGELRHFIHDPASDPDENIEAAGILDRILDRIPEP